MKKANLCECMGIEKPCVETQGLIINCLILT